MHAETTTSPKRRTTTTWRRCGATCAATGAASTNSSAATPRCTGQHRATMARRSSPFSWRRARPWTSLTVTARELRRRRGAAGWCLDLSGGRGRTPLHYAASHGLTEHARLLLAAKASVDIKDDWGRGPQPMSQNCLFKIFTGNALNSCSFICGMFG